MKKKLSYKSIILSTFLLFVLTVSSCNQKKNKMEELNVMDWGDGNASRQKLALIRAFENENPGVKINLTTITGNRYNEKILSMVAMGADMDIITVKNYLTPAWSQKNIFEPLDGYVAGSDIKKENFYKEALDTFTWNNVLYAVPESIPGHVLFYNKNLFESQGLSYPDLNWDWFNFLNAAKKLTIDENKDGKTDIYGYFHADPWQWIWGNGGDIFDNLKNPSACTLNTPASIGGVTFNQDLIHRHRVAPNAVESQNTVHYSMFQAGNLGMFIHGSIYTEQFINITKFDWDIAQIPKGSAGRMANHGGTGFAIYTKSKKKDLAWKYIQFLSSVKAEDIKNKYILFFSPNSKHQELLDYTRYKDKNIKAIFDTFDQSRNEFLLPEYEEIRVIVNRGFELIFQGGNDPTDVLNDTTSQVNTFLKENSYPKE